MVNKNKFKKESFKTYGVIENSIKESYRVPNGWAPINNISIIDLREKIRDLMWEKAEEYRVRKNEKISDYNFIERVCCIPSDTIKKAISGKYKISRQVLSKFAIGIGLNIEESNELFTMHSGELNLTNDFDFIVYHAIESKDNIDSFMEEALVLAKIDLNKSR